MPDHAQITFIGRIRSELKTLSDCPHQGSEGAPEARIEIFPAYLDALDGITPDTRVVVLTWLDRADRTTLRVHPRGNPDNPLTGVFVTRSPSRPNPIGLHEVRVISVDRTPPVLAVAPLETLDNTPVVDIKLSWPRDVQAQP